MTMIIITMMMREKVAKRLRKDVYKLWKMVH